MWRLWNDKTGQFILGMSTSNAKYGDGKTPIEFSSIGEALVAIDECGEWGRIEPVSYEEGE